MVIPMACIIASAFSFQHPAVLSEKPMTKDFNQIPAMDTGDDNTNHIILIVVASVIWILVVIVGIFLSWLGYRFYYEKRGEHRLSDTFRNCKKRTFFLKPSIQLIMAYGLYERINTEKF